MLDEETLLVMKETLKEVDDVESVRDCFVILCDMLLREAEMQRDAMKLKLHIDALTEECGRRDKGETYD